MASEEHPYSSTVLFLMTLHSTVRHMVIAKHILPMATCWQNWRRAQCRWCLVFANCWCWLTRYILFSWQTTWFDWTQFSVILLSVDMLPFASFTIHLKPSINDLISCTFRFTVVTLGNKLISIIFMLNYIYNNIFILIMVIYRLLFYVTYLYIMYKN